MQVWIEQLQTFPIFSILLLYTEAFIAFDAILTSVNPCVMVSKQVIMDLSSWGFHALIIAEICY